MTGDNVLDIGGNGQTPSSLLEKIKAKDPKGWERFVHLYSSLVYRWCRQGSLQEADAADVGQEVFRVAFVAIGEFHHDQKGDTLRGWLRAITRNKIRDFWRKTRPDLGEGGSDALHKLQQIAAKDLPEENESSIQEENLLIYRRVVEMILATCEEQTRLAFLRAVIERQSAAEVARDLGISVNAVYLAKSRILRRICAEFAGLVVT